MAGTYIQTGASTFTEITGTKGIYAQTGASTYTVVKQVYVQTGASTYTLVYQYDVTPPTGGGITSVVWNQGLPGFTVNFASTSDATSGIASYSLQYSADGSSYSSLGSISTAGGSYSYSVTSGNRGNLHYFRTVAVDNIGNTNTSAAVATYAKPLGTFYVTTTGHNTYGSNGGWRSDFANIGSIFSGWINSTYGYQYGHWFYGTGVSTVAKGYVPDSATIRTYRSSADGCSGAVVAFGTHNYASQPAGAPANDTTYWTTGTSQTQLNAREFTLTAATRGRMAVDANFGMFMYPGNADGTINGTASTSCGSGSTYRIFDSPISDANSGRLTLVFN